MKQFKKFYILKVVKPSHHDEMLNICKKDDICVVVGKNHLSDYFILEVQFTDGRRIYLDKNTELERLK